MKPPLKFISPLINIPCNPLTSAHHDFLNKSAKRIFHDRKRERERHECDGGRRCHHGSTIPTPSGVCPPSIRPLAPHVPVNFLKATRLARGYNSRRFGPRSTAGTDVRVGIRLPFTARHEHAGGHRCGQVRIAAQSCGVCNSAGGT